MAADYLPFLRDTANAARFALALKPGTTVDTLGNDFDQGYTAELMIDLTKLGYPAGLGDRTLFLGIDYLDGDSFTPFNKSYGTRTWWGREYEHECCPVWAYLDPALTLTAVDDPAGAATRFALLGSYPNPARAATTLRFALPEPSRVSLEVFDAQGRRVAQRALGVMAAGIRTTTLATTGLPSGIYVYRLRMSDPVRGTVRALLSSKLMLLH